MIRVQGTHFDPGAEINSFLGRNPNSGGIATFIGQVRDFQPAQNSSSSEVTSLELEHYPGMTEKELERIVADSFTRWPLDDALVIHLYGQMKPGDSIVLVCTAATHRGDAFASCEFIMDWLKTKAPFWKREQTQAGTTWVAARANDTERADRWAKD